VTEAVDSHQAVCDVVYAFAEAMDLRNWALYRSLFTPVIELDYSFFHSDQIGPIAAESWVSNVERRLTRHDATQHAMSNPRTRIDGASAECTMYVQAHHLATIDGAKAWCMVSGQYTFGLVYQSHRWVIRAIALRPLVITGDERVLAVARA
jgi:SnoaL-like domain